MRAQPEPGFGGGEHAPSTTIRAQPEPAFGEGEHAPSSTALNEFDRLTTAGALPSDATRKLRDGALDRFLNEARIVDVNSPLDGARFYSGDEMREYAEDNTDGVNTMVVTDTPGGQYFRDMFQKDRSPLSKRQWILIWQLLSRRFAENASGKVTSWVNEPRPGGVWEDIELPALRANPKVTEINELHPLHASRNHDR